MIRKHLERAMSSLRRGLLPIAALLVASCGDEGTALRLKLVVDPQLNSEAQLLSVVNSIELVLDAQEGFSAVPDGGELVAKDVDNDGMLELVLTKSVQGLKSFPMYRLLPGSGGRSFTITARGWVGNQVAAVGGSAPAKFVDGQSAEVTVPLNLRPGFRAPRVIMALPHDGQDAVPQALSSIYVEFSKWIASGSAEKHLRLTTKVGGADVDVPGTWAFKNIAVTELGYTEERTGATFQRDATCYDLIAGEFHIVAEAAITDTSGAPLVQDAMTSQPNGYRSTFRVVPSADIAPPAANSACVTVKPTQVGCTTLESCNPNGGEAFICVKPADASLAPYCAPSGKTCGNCPTGYVCAPVATSTDPSTPAPTVVASCVPDCRANGCPTMIPGVGAVRCNVVSGICDPCLIAAAANVAPTCNLACPGTPGGCRPGMFCNPDTKQCAPCDPNTQKACFF
jgi:hypothetical protein